MKSRKRAPASRSHLCHKYELRPLTFTVPGDGSRRHFLNLSPKPANLPCFRKWPSPSTLKITIQQVLKKYFSGFPGGIVVKNLPANAGDTGSSPGPGSSHVPRSNEARAPQLLNLRSRACKPQLLKPARLEPGLRNKRSHRNEKPAHRNEE